MLEVAAVHAEKHNTRQTTRAMAALREQLARRIDRGGSCGTTRAVFTILAGVPDRSMWGVPDNVISAGYRNATETSCHRHAE
jgi:hypothetical protein